MSPGQKNEWPAVLLAANGGAAQPGAGDVPGMGGCGRPAEGGAGPVGENAPVVSPESPAPVPAPPSQATAWWGAGAWCGPGAARRPGAWPLRSRLAFGAYPGAVPSARLHTRLLAAEWRLGHLADVAELVASELVTNALRATEALTGYREHGTWRAGRPPVWLWVWSDGSRVLVQVWDAGERMPLTREPGLDDEHGRGLLLVESLSTRRGVYRLPGTSGKVVWAAVGPDDSR